ncbi:hypothetical protein [Lysinibacillus parviboronicapiens]|uniref:hypothetical protein n=1 Tax=Lysinibacillus parviboronicapiens TaxID=436516 RepID=UPI0006D00924|nr:hypothetical protein [Lysinibacillus parviboronicapiens]
MSRFLTSRSYKQLIAERKAMEHFMQYKRDTFGEDITVKQRAELQSDEALLKEIVSDIETARDRIGRTIKEECV